MTNKKGKSKGKGNDRSRFPAGMTNKRGNSKGKKGNGKKSSGMGEKGNE